MQLFSAIAVTALAMTLSMILGPVLSEAVGDAFGFAAAFWFLAGLLVIGLAFLIPLRVPDHEADDGALGDPGPRTVIGRRFGPPAGR